MNVLSNRRNLAFTGRRTVEVAAAFGLAMVAALAADPQTTANSVVMDETARRSKLRRMIHGVKGDDICKSVNRPAGVCT